MARFQELQHIVASGTKVIISANHLSKKIVKKKKIINCRVYWHKNLKF